MINSILRITAVSVLAIGQTAMTFADAENIKKQEKHIISPVKDEMQSLEPGAINIGGWIGRRMETTMVNRIMEQDIEKLVLPFRTRINGSWDTEYWGKWFTSAAYMYHYQPTKEHKSKIDTATEELLKTQTKDGQLTGFAPKDQLGRNWDLWGRKYALHGLIMHYDATNDKKSLNAARKAADYIVDKVDKGMFIPEQCVSWHGGIQSTAIATEFAQLYARTGDERYRETAELIFEQSELPNQINNRGLRLLSDPASGVSPSQMSSLKAYEVLTNYEGLYELYHSTGKHKYLESLTGFLDQICSKELMIHGSLSNNEYWFNGTVNQSNFLERPTETCATAQWMIICYDMLKMTGDSKWADLLETALYNALAGAMLPDGHWWAYFSSFNGERVPCPMHHGNQAMTCCVASGPRGLMLTPMWAVMKTENGVAINHYGESTAETVLENGTKARIIQKGNYPEEGKVSIQMELSTESEFEVMLRIPEWSKKTTLKVNGKQHECRAGEYAVINREWKNGDTIELELDMRGRVIKAKDGGASIAIARGPVLFSLDSRTVSKDDNRALYINYSNDGYIDLKRVEAPEGVWMAYEVPVYFIGGPQPPASSQPLVFIDYPSAGNKFTAENTFTTWIPQPIFMQSAFIKGQWKLLANDRPYIPFGKDLELAADVTETIRGFINSGVYEFGVSRENLLCDPAPGTTKELTVTYSADGKTETASSSEGQKMNLKDALAGKKDIKIIKARYGVPKNDK